MYFVWQIGDVDVIEVGGDLDAFSSPNLATAIDRCSRFVSRSLVVSLEFCEYCDASGISVLVRAKTRLGDGLRIVVPLENRIRRVFRITRLEESLSLDKSLQSALRIRPLSGSRAFDDRSEIAS